MFTFFKNRKLLQTAYDEALAAYGENQQETGWQALTTLLQAQKEDSNVANMLIDLIREDVVPFKQGCDILNQILKHHSKDLKLLFRIGNNLEFVRDIDELNLAASEHPVFQNTIDAITAALSSCEEEEREDLLDARSSAARMMARQHDDMAANDYRKLTEISPKDAHYHYNLGLFCKTRGLFAEGVKANQTALTLAEDDPASNLWNLGICATGAGEADIALDTWKKIGCKIKMGRFDLPDGRFPSCKVKLAEFPLAERSKDNDHPGQQETVWIERLSPCHGIIKSVLYYDIGVDYGDVILTDGAPITYHKYGDDDIAVFPHLATLLKRNYLFYDFAAIQQENKQISSISDSLEQDAVVYSHTENFRILCANCFKDPNCNQHEDNPEQKHIVKGRVAAPPDYDPALLLAHIDAELKKLQGCEFYSPDLCKAAGLDDRRKGEEEKFEVLVADS